MEGYTEGLLVLDILGKEAVCTCSHDRLVSRGCVEAENRPTVGVRNAGLQICTHNASASAIRLRVEDYIEMAWVRMGSLVTTVRHNEVQRAALIDELSSRRVRIMCSAQLLKPVGLAVALEMSQSKGMRRRQINLRDLLKDLLLLFIRVVRIVADEVKVL